MKFISKLILAYIILSSWTNAFAITSWLTIPTLLLLLIIISYTIYIISNNTTFKIGINYSLEDYVLLIILILILILSVILNNSKTINYVLAYLITFLGGYLMIKTIITKHLKFREVMNSNLIGVLIVGYFGFIDFFLQVFVDIKIQDSIPRSMKADAIHMQMFLPRNYGFSEEPTYLAWYLNTLGLIALWWLFVKVKLNLSLKIMITIPIFITYLTTFSGAGIPLLLFWTIVVMFFKGNYKDRVAFFIIFLIIVLLGSIAFNSDFYDLIEPIIKKATFQQDKDGDRGNLWALRIKDFSKSPILGLGLGYYSSIGEESPVNYFLFILLELGIFPIAFYFVFYATVFVKLFRYSGDGNKVFLIAFGAGVSHLLTQSLFFHPCLWLLIIFFQKLKYSKNEIAKKT